MKLTNKLGINKAFANALAKDWYGARNEERDYSVTQLLQPAKIYHLTARHWNELEEDISDRIFMLLGTAIHAILERANADDFEFIILSRVRQFFHDLHDGKYDSLDEAALEREFVRYVSEIDSEETLGKMLSEIKGQQFIVERRFKYITRNGLKITGGVDIYDKINKIMEDYKLTSLWTWIYRNAPDSGVENWTQQLNMYRLFMERAGWPVDKLRVNMIMRDFSKSEAERKGKDYPNHVECLELPVMGLDVVEAMIEEKVEALERWKDVPDDQIPECDPKERWQKKDTWAVMKRGNKRATKVEYSHASADAYMSKIVDNEAERDIAKGANPSVAYNRAREKYYIEKRPGSNPRCESYCPVREFCHFGRTLNVSK